MCFGDRLMQLFFKRDLHLVIELAKQIVRLIVVQKINASYKILKQQTVTALDWEPDAAQLENYLVELVYQYKSIKTLLSIPHPLLQTHSLTMNAELTPAEITETVHLELERYCTNVNDYYFDFQVTNPHEVRLVTLERGVLANLLNVLQAAKLKLLLITTHTDASVDIQTITSYEAQSGAIINLLPWRTVQQQKQKRIFLLSLLITSMMLIIFSIIGHHYLAHKIYQTQQQLQQLQTIAKNNEQLQIAATQNKKKIQEHHKQFNELQKLNARRYFLLHALDLFANKLPNGMYLTSMQQQDGILQIEGRAANHHAITQLVTILSATPEFKLAQLQFIKEIANSNQLAFAIQVPELLPKAELHDELTLE